MTVESKIDSPVEAKDSTVELKIYLPVETKQSIVNYHSDERNKSFPKDRVNVQRKRSLELTTKRRKVREREPSRILIRKVLYALLKKRFRKKIRVFIVRNVPNSSRLYYLGKNFRRWWLKIDKVTFDCNYIFSSSLAKPKHCQNKEPWMYEICDNRLQVKSTKDSSQDIQKLQNPNIVRTKNLGCMKYVTTDCKSNLQKTVLKTYKKKVFSQANY